MATTVSITHCGIQVTGPTVTAAKQEAARQITRLVEDLEKGLEVLHVHGITAVVWRAVEGWRCTVLTNTNTGTIYGVPGYENRHEAVIAAVTHAAQVAWTHAVENDAEFVSTALDQVRGFHQMGNRNRTLRELVEYFAWQRRYKAARDAGHSDGEAHEIASGLHRSAPVA